jgi:hypothetical protein
MTDDFELWERELARKDTFRARAIELDHEALARAAIEQEMS